MRVYLRHKDGVVQEHLVNPLNAHVWFERLVDRTVPAQEDEIYERGRCTDFE